MRRRIILMLYISLTLILLASCLTPGRPASAFQDQEQLIQLRPFYPPRKTFSFSGIFFGLTSDTAGPALSLRFSRGSLEALVGEVEVTSAFLPAFQFQGTLSAYGPAELLLQVHRVRIFDNWNNGWLEGEANAFGTFLFTRHYLTWRTVMRDPLGIGEIKSGEVRYFDRYYRKEEGTLRVHVRIEQLKRFVEKLREESNTPVVIGGAGFIGVSGFIGASKTKEGSGSIGAPGTADSLLRTIPNQFLYEKEVEETPGLFLSLYNLPLVNRRFLKEEIPVFEAE